MRQTFNLFKEDETVVVKVQILGICFHFCVKEPNQTKKNQKTKPYKKTPNKTNKQKTNHKNKQEHRHKHKNKSKGKKHTQKNPQTCVTFHHVFISLLHPRYRTG